MATLLRFIRRQAPYQVGEVAGFPAATAQRYLASGAAVEYIEAAPLTTAVEAPQADKAMDAPPAHTAVLAPAASKRRRKAP